MNTFRKLLRLKCPSKIDRNKAFYTRDLNKDLDDSERFHEYGYLIKKDYLFNFVKKMSIINKTLVIPKHNTKEDGSEVSKGGSLATRMVQS